MLGSCRTFIEDPSPKEPETSAAGESWIIFLADRSQDIHSRYYILEFLTTSAVLVNAGLVAFTGSFADGHSAASRVWIFVGISTGVLLLKYLIAVLIPDVPNDVTIQLKRTEFFHEKLRFQDASPESQATANRGNDAPSTYSILNTDDDQ